MRNLVSRLLLVVAALVLAAGGLMHARAFAKTLVALAASNLAPFYASALKALWLIDSATLLTLAVVFAVVAARPPMASRLVVVLLALVPAATSFFLYRYLGHFLPAHLLAGAAASAALGGLMLPTRT